jgi:hypothetical protein
MAKTLTQRLLESPLKRELIASLVAKRPIGGAKDRVISWWADVKIRLSERRHGTAFVRAALLFAM